MCDLCPASAPTENRQVLCDMRGLVWMALCAVCIKRLAWITQKTSTR